MEDTEGTPRTETEAQETAQRLEQSLACVRSGTRDPDERQLALAVVQSALTGQMGAAGTRWCAQHLPALGPALLDPFLAPAGTDGTGSLYQLRALLDCACSALRAPLTTPTTTATSEQEGEEGDDTAIKAAAEFAAWALKSDTLVNVAATPEQLAEAAEADAGDAMDADADAPLFVGQLRTATDYAAAYFARHGGFAALVDVVKSCIWSESGDSSSEGDETKKEQRPPSAARLLAVGPAATAFKELPQERLGARGRAMVRAAALEAFVPWLAALGARDAAVLAAHDCARCVEPVILGTYRMLAPHHHDARVARPLEEALLHAVATLLPHAAARAYCCETAGSFAVWLWNKVFGTDPAHPHYCTLQWLSADALTDWLVRSGALAAVLETAADAAAAGKSTLSDRTAYVLFAVTVLCGRNDAALETLWQFFTRLAAAAAGDDKDPRKAFLDNALSDLATRQAYTITTPPQTRLKWFVARFARCTPAEVAPGPLVFVRAVVTATRGVLGAAALDAARALLARTGPGLLLSPRARAGVTDLCTTLTRDVVAAGMNGTALDVALARLACARARTAPAALRAADLECSFAALACARDDEDDDIDDDVDDDDIGHVRISADEHYARYIYDKQCLGELFDVVVDLHKEQVHREDGDMEEPVSENEAAEGRVVYERQLARVLTGLRKHVLRPLARVNHEPFRPVCDALLGAARGEGEAVVFLRWLAAAAPDTDAAMGATALDAFAAARGAHTTPAALEAALALFCALGAAAAPPALAWDGVSVFSARAAALPHTMPGFAALRALVAAVPDDAFPLVRDFVVQLYASLDAHTDPAAADLSLAAALLGPDCARPARGVRVLDAYLAQCGLSGEDEGDDDAQPRLFVQVPGGRIVSLAIPCRATPLRTVVIDALRAAGCGDVPPPSSSSSYALVFRDKVYDVVVSDGDDLADKEGEQTLETIGAQSLDVVAVVAGADRVGAEEWTRLYDVNEGAWLSVAETQRRTGAAGARAGADGAALVASLADVAPEDAGTLLAACGGDLARALGAATAADRVHCHPACISTRARDPSALRECLQRPEVRAVVTSVAHSACRADADAAWRVLRVLKCDCGGDDDWEAVVLVPDTEDVQGLAKGLAAAARAAAAAPEVCEALVGTEEVAANLFGGVIRDTLIARVRATATATAETEGSRDEALHAYMLLLRIGRLVQARGAAACARLEESGFVAAVLELLCDASTLAGTAEPERQARALSLALCLGDSSPAALARAATLLRAHRRLLAPESTLTEAECALRDDVVRAACAAVARAVAPGTTAEQHTGVAEVVHAAIAAIAGADECSDAACAQFFARASALLPRASAPLPRATRTLLVLGVQAAAQQCPVLVLPALTQVSAAAAPASAPVSASSDGAAATTSTNRAPAHPALDAADEQNAAVDCVLQQLLACRPLVEGVCALDDARLDAAADAAPGTTTAVDGVLAAEAVRSLRAFFGAALAGARDGQPWDARALRRRLCDVCKFTTPRNALRAVAKALRGTGNAALAALLSVPGAGSKGADDVLLGVEASARMEDALRAHAPQLFAPAAALPAQLYVFPTGRDGLVPVGGVPRTLRLAGGRTYALTGLVLLLRAAPRTYRACVRTGRGWRLCGTGAGGSNDVLPLAESFVARYLAGDSVAWARAPATALVFTAVDAMFALDAEETEKTEKTEKEAVNEGERRALVWTLAAAELAQARAAGGEVPDALGRTVLGWYECALEDADADAVALWQPLVLGVLSAAPPRTSTEFLLDQIAQTPCSGSEGEGEFGGSSSESDSSDSDSSDSDSDSSSDEDEMKNEKIINVTKKKDGQKQQQKQPQQKKQKREKGTGTSRMERVLLRCADERVRVLYEHALVRALGRAETAERAALAALDLAGTRTLADVEARVPAGLAVPAVLAAALRLLGPARAVWRRFKQCLALLHDAAHLAPACVRLLLAADVAGEYRAWFLNEPTALSPNHAFISQTLLPDLSPFIALLSFIYRQVKEQQQQEQMQEQMQEQDHGERFIEELFETNFVTQLVRYPYSPGAVRALLAAHCRGSHEAAAHVWEALYSALVDARAEQRPMLDAHVVHFCADDEGDGTRVALALDAQTGVLALWTPRLTRTPECALADAVLFGALCACAPVRAALCAHPRRVLWLEQAARARAATALGRDFADVHRVRDADPAALLRLPPCTLYALRTPPPLVTAYNLVRFACAALQGAADAAAEAPVEGYESEGEHQRAMAAMLSELRAVTRQEEKQSMSQKEEMKVDDEKMQVWNNLSQNITPSNSPSKMDTDDAAFEVNVQNIKAIFPDATDDQIRDALHRNHNNPNEAVSDLLR